MDFCNSLQKNTNLKSIRWDRNGIGVGGWQSLYNLLSTNKTICHVPFPHVDYEKVEKEGKYPKVKELMESISHRLRTNSGGTSYESLARDKEGRTYGGAGVIPLLNYDEGGAAILPDQMSPTLGNPNSYDSSYNSEWSSNDVPPTPPPFYDESDVNTPPPTNAEYVADNQGIEFDDSQYGGGGDLPPPPPPPIF